MIDTFQLLKIFISSPGDVPEERNIAEKTIENVNNSCRDTLGVKADAHTWKRMIPITPSMAEKKVQDIINEEVRGCNVFVLILNKRYGTLEKGHTKSNTEREIGVALKMLKEGRNIQFLAYFKTLPPNPDQGTQEQKVRILRQELQKRGIIYKDFASSEEFRDNFSHDLYHTILKYQFSTSKRKVLKQFWQFGTPDGKTHPQLALIYPPVDRYFMRSENPDRIWLNRLLPHIVFEDFKALQKFEKTLRLVGFRDFEFFNISDVPPDIEDRNRLWICLPRSKNAQQQLSLYKDRSLFQFTERKLTKEACILWRSNLKTRNFINIHSPLGKYLNIQRQKSPGGEWEPGYGRIIAKDYAVLARFSDNRDRAPMLDGKLKDYFIAGIRGLGTWGAAWFLDRRYNSLKNYLKKDDNDIQVLLEVTYKNEQIFDVKDVSKEPESYFEEENRLRTIVKNLKKG